MKHTSKLVKKPKAKSKSRSKKHKQKQKAKANAVVKNTRKNIPEKSEKQSKKNRDS